MLFFVTAQLFAQHNNRKRIPENSKPKNIILMIGDGMGLAQMYAAYTTLQDNMNISRCNQIALVKTFSESNYITDSAAAATALATGRKTNNGMLGMLPDKTPLKSIVKYAEEKGLSTGIVATSSLTHATPAGFVACVESRKMNEEIARQYLFTDVDVIIGGGYNEFTLRKDSLNLIDSLRIRGYTIARTIPEMMNTLNGKLAALLYPEHAPKISEGRGDMLSLATSKAIDLLGKNKQGFFLMVEGSQIDWGGHDNNINYNIDETIDFDKACGVALDFAERNNETLVIIAADHETGGLSLTEETRFGTRPEGKYSTKEHTAIPTVLYAFGPGQDTFSGIINNTDIFRKMYYLFGF